MTFADGDRIPAPAAAVWFRPGSHWTHCVPFSCCERCVQTPSGVIFSLDASSCDITRGGNALRVWCSEPGWRLACLYGMCWVDRGYECATCACTVNAQYPVRGTASIPRPRPRPRPPPAAGTDRIPPAGRPERTGGRRARRVSGTTCPALLHPSHAQRILAAEVRSPASHGVRQTFRHRVANLA